VLRTPDEGLDRSPVEEEISRGTQHDARVYRQALTYAIDELHAPYAAAVTFAAHHVNVGRILWEGDLDRSWQDWRDRPEAARLLDDTDE